MADVDYEAWALEMCSLLDAIEMAANDPARVRQLVRGRFDIAEKHGLKVIMSGPSAGPNN